MKVTLLGVSGGSGSGKTTFANRLYQSLPKGVATILAQDNYYIDQSAHFDEDGGAVNFDHPDSLDFDLLAEHLISLKKGQIVEVPLYDFKTHTRLDETLTLEPTPLIIIDGILLLSQEKLRDIFCASVFVDTCEDLRYERRLKRDVEERGRTPEGVRNQFIKQVKPMHDLFVEPSKNYATHLIETDDHFEKVLAKFVGMFS